MPSSDEAEYTGRYIVLLAEGAVEQGMRSLQKAVGVKATILKGDRPEEQPDVLSENVIFSSIGAAVVQLDPDQLRSLGVADEKGEMPVLAIEPERVVRAFPLAEPGGNGLGARTSLPPWPETPSSLRQPAGLSQGVGLARAGALPAELPFEEAAPQEFSAAYLRGYRDSVVQLVERLLAEGSVAAKSRIAPGVEAWNESEATWGLQATRVVTSRYTGRGIKVAVLDTGFGPHRDFGGRNILTASFVQGQQVADGHGHGTHCIGTASGFRPVAGAPRYGIAYESDILVGKVLSNEGVGADGGILAGINWAVAQGAYIISMSLGARVLPGQTYSRVFDEVARRAMLGGTLVIAAAGNDSHRPGDIKPVSHPANCPFIAAVGAVDQNLQVAWFSCGGVNPNGGEVNIAAPGVDVYSSVPLPPYYRRMSGTSMATPHVAGIAALFAEATHARGMPLFEYMARAARPLPLPRRDVGRGLVQAP